MYQIRILWIANELNLNILGPVLNAVKGNPKFDIKIVATCRRKYDFSHGYTAQEVGDFLFENSVSNTIMEGSEDDLNTLKTYSPKFIFTSTPYDIYLPTAFCSKNLSNLGNLCTINYGGLYRPLESRKENDYYINCSLAFEPNLVRDDCNKTLPIGSLKYEWLTSLRHHSLNQISDIKKGITTIAWRPRWTFDQTESTFISYCTYFQNFVSENPRIIVRLILHPMLIENSKHKGTHPVVRDFLENMSTHVNFELVDPTDEYLPKLLDSDLLISDYSTIIPEFMVTGNPVIYTSHSIKLNSFGEILFSHTYNVDNIKELQDKINDLLQGNDPEKYSREKFKNSIFFTPPRGQIPSAYLLSILLSYEKSRSSKLNRLIFWFKYKAQFCFLTCLVTLFRNIKR